MNIKELQTPSVLIRSKAMYDNLNNYQNACNTYNKQLWPMLKTHKSTSIARLQQQMGATGFLCGTLDECETLCDQGIKKIMYAYPVAGEVSCKRAVELAKRCEFYARVDHLENARQLDEMAKSMNVHVNCTIILDCGLHRFGMEADKILPFANAMNAFTNLHLCGISTHCGHVYSESEAKNVPLYAKQEIEAIHKAVDDLKGAGFEVSMVTTGATPTFFNTIDDDYIQIYHPGNYIFNDRIQMTYGVAKEEDCSLVVYATVISQPHKDLFICDAGAKCLGLDQGAHGNNALQGHGSIIGHPELLVTSLSEEVGKIHISGHTDVKIGDRIMIIPNHSCSSANLTNHYFLVDEDGEITDVISADIRGNSTLKGFV